MMKGNAVDDQGLGEKAALLASVMSISLICRTNHQA